jgi:hypothetical protein
MNQEQQRLEAAKSGQTPWKKWDPYLSERQWGTVCEDYSATGTAWDYFPHDQVRSRAYRWGEAEMLNQAANRRTFPKETHFGSNFSSCSSQCT